MSCSHEKYKGKNYMMYENALKAMSQNKIVWLGMIVTHCECGVDISHARRVRVKAFKEYMRDIK